MLSGSAILRISALLVVAGCLAALVQFLLPRPAPEPAAPRPANGAPSVAATTTPAPRRVDVAPAPLQRPVPSPPTTPATTPEPPPAPSPAPVILAAPHPPAPTPVPVGDAAEAASDAAGPRAVTLVDLNTGSLSDLNGLRGGGSIGRAIVQRRPYASIDQLLSKRVLSRATYDKIKDQVTVR